MTNAINTASYARHYNRPSWVDKQTEIEFIYTHRTATYLQGELSWITTKIMKLVTNQDTVDLSSWCIAFPHTRSMHMWCTLQYIQHTTFITDNTSNEHTIFKSSMSLNWLNEIDWQYLGNALSAQKCWTIIDNLMLYRSSLPAQDVVHHLQSEINFT